MLEGLKLAVTGLLANLLGYSPAPLPAVPFVPWQEAKIFSTAAQSDPTVTAIVEDYLNQLAAQGFDRQQQGVWLQSEWAYFGQYRDDIPVAAASLTKIATTLAALQTWGPDHRFQTRFWARGAMEKDVLRGDLVVEGSGDPLLVWEEAIAVGNALNQLGIRQVTGNLIIKGNFYLNFKSNPQVAGELFRQALAGQRWTAAIVRQYQQLLPGTPRPQLAIAGAVEVRDALPPGSRLLLRHQSLPLTEILQQMNIYSNNEMAEMLAQGVGGPQVVAQISAEAAGVPPAEIQLVNGSGLSTENRLSPRAASGMLMALERQLAGSPVKVGDLFPVTGRDRTGTMQWRSMPVGVAVKTGTLAQVSALAGVIPTQERGPVWFAIINHGPNIEKFRSEQDRLLQRLAQHWQLQPEKMMARRAETVFLGDPSRNLPVGGRQE